MRIRLTAEDLRDIVREEISNSIEGYRASRAFDNPNYKTPVGLPTEQEVTDFIRTNQLLDLDTIVFLTEHSYLGFEARYDSVRAEWLEEFRSRVNDWSATETWLGADLIDITTIIEFEQPVPKESMIWHPNSSVVQPNWIQNSRTALIIAANLLKKGRLLSELDWRKFEQLIAELLERSGWSIELTRGSKDGGIDVVSTIEDAEVGLIKALWQAKKYHPKNKVGLEKVRELSAIRDDQKATKAVIVTTSHLTSGALDWIRRDEFRLGYREKTDIEQWVLDSI